MSRLARQEYHGFEAAGQRFLYLVPSAAVFAIDACAAAVLDALDAGPRAAGDLVQALAPQFGEAAVVEALAELQRVRAVAEAGPAPRPPRVLPLVPLPLETLVVNVTNQCNLSCTYCYEYGEDRLVNPASDRRPKFMSEETARASIDFALREAGDHPSVHVTFFGGETLLNVGVLRRTVAYARARAAALGKEVDFSLTTNATLLKPDIIDFLADERIGVTVSIDGPVDLQDRFRVFHSGAGSYDVVAPKIRALLTRHRTRPIGARVTLTRQTLDVGRIFRHLTEDLGFWEVGFAPVTTAPGRDYAIGDRGFDDLLGQFRALAADFLAAALEDRHHGFSNVRETLAEIHQGHAKAYPCGAGIGLMGVATDGELALCHRFAGSEAHALGTVQEGVDRARQRAFLEAHHVDGKTECRTCWARPICAGGCYHEAHTRYGSTSRPNLHYCEWIRGWTHTCLEIYGALAVGNPRFLHRLEAPARATAPGELEAARADRAAGAGASRAGAGT